MGKHYRSATILAVTWSVAALLASALAFLPAKQHSRYAALDFYVSTAGSDSNNGSASRPWRTIGHAAQLVIAGSTVHVSPGEYRENVLTAIGGSPSKPIRFISELQGEARVVGSAGDAIWENKADYVDIVGFDVTGSAPVGIDNLGSYVRILGNTVHDIVAACDSNGGAGIDNEGYSAHDDEVGFNFVHDVRPRASCPQRHGVGIYQANLNGRINDNLVIGCGAEGIQLWHAANSVFVANNTVLNALETGILIGAGDSPGGITDDHSMVVNNIAVNNGYYGILEHGRTGAHNTYLNNLVYGNPGANIHLLTGNASGTIVSDPLFVKNTGDWRGDYHLSLTSPAIDAGVTDNAPSTDIAGHTRLQAHSIDLGAYQHTGTARKWPWM